MSVVAAPFDSALQEAYLSLWRTYDRLRVLEDQVFASWDLTAQQYNVLRILDAAGDQPVATLSLASKLISRAPDITRMIDRLEKNGWLRRERSETDRRAVMLKITEEGRDLLQRIAEPLRDCHQCQLGHMSEAELATLITLLGKARDPHELDNSRWKIS